MLDEEIKIHHEDQRLSESPDGPSFPLDGLCLSIPLEEVKLVEESRWAWDRSISIVHKRYYPQNYTIDPSRWGVPQSQAMTIRVASEEQLDQGLALIRQTIAAATEASSSDAPAAVVHAADTPAAAADSSKAGGDANESKGRAEEAGRCDVFDVEFLKNIGFLQQGEQLLYFHSIPFSVRWQMRRLSSVLLLAYLSIFPSVIAADGPAPAALVAFFFLLTVCVAYNTRRVYVVLTSSRVARITQKWGDMISGLMTCCCCFHQSGAVSHSFLFFPYVYAYPMSTHYVAPTSRSSIFSYAPLALFSFSSSRAAPIHFHRRFYIEVPHADVLFVDQTIVSNFFKAAAQMRSRSFKSQPLFTAEEVQAAEEAELEARLRQVASMRAMEQGAEIKSDLGPELDRDIS